MKRRAVFSSVTLMLLFVSAAIADIGPHCAWPPRACEMELRADAVFIGSVIDVDKSNVRMWVEEVFRGSAKGEVHVVANGSFNGPVVVHRSYLVHGLIAKDGSVRISACYGLKPIDNAKADVAYFRSPPKPSDGALKTIVVRRMRVWNAEGKLQPSKRAPQSGVEVVVTPSIPEAAGLQDFDAMPAVEESGKLSPETTPSKSFDELVVARGVTDDSGTVTFTSLQPGYYGVWVKKGEDGGFGRFEGVCAGDSNEIDFEIEYGTTISGQVYLPDGKLNSDATVGLVRAREDGEPGESFAGAGNNKGGFEFSDIPPGTYYLQVSAYPSDPFRSAMQKIVVEEGRPKMTVEIFLLPK